MQQLELNPMHNLQIILVQSKNPSKDTSLIRSTDEAKRRRRKLMGPSLELYFDSANVLAEKKDYISFVTHTIGCPKSRNY